MSTIMHVGSVARGSLPAMIDPADGITPITPSAITTLIIKNGTDTIDTATVTAVGGGYTGVYKWSYDPSGEVESDKFTIVFTITIGGDDYYYTEDICVIASVISAANTQSASIIERSSFDDKAITFSFPSPSLTLVGERSINNATFEAVDGAISYLREEGGFYLYTLAYHVDDRPVGEGFVRYRFVESGWTSGDPERFITLRTDNNLVIGQSYTHTNDLTSEAVAVTITETS
jgi:hypothetical protein